MNNIIYFFKLKIKNSCNLHYVLHYMYYNFLGGRILRCAIIIFNIARELQLLIQLKSQFQRTMRIKGFSVTLTAIGCC